MRVGIIGNGPLAVHFAKEIQRIDGDYLILGNPFAVKSLYQQFPKIFDVPFPDDFLPEEFNILNCKVLSVQKSLFRPEDSTSSRKRMRDLFRVNLLQDLGKEVEKSLSSHPDLKQKISDQDQSYLEEPFESFQEFDFIIDAREKWEGQRPLGGSSYSLNENRHRNSGQIFYGIDALRFVIENLLDDQGKTSSLFKDKKSLAIVGSTSLASKIFFMLKDVLLEKKIELSLVQEDKKVFSNLRGSVSNRDLEAAKDAESMIELVKSDFNAKADEFKKLVTNWKNLSAEKRVEEGRPSEPTPLAYNFSGYKILSLDKMIEEEKIYMTLDLINKDLAATKPQVKVLPLDYILIANGERRDLSFYHQLELDIDFASGEAKDECGFHPEAGLYFCSRISQIQNILFDMNSFFTKKELNDVGSEKFYQPSQMSDVSQERGV